MERIEVLNMDTLEGALDLKDNKYNPVLLNMCNGEKRGGFYNLFGGQEEDLIRRGNYLEHLKKEEYPIKENCAIYSKNVTFDKKRIKGRYVQVEKRSMCLIACHAVKNNLPGIRLNSRNESIMRKKIELIFSLAKRKNHDSLVLSAFGCGGYRNPPEHISLLFRDAILKWGRYFKIIRFCIFDDNHIKSNFSIFKNVIGKMQMENETGIKC